MNSDYYDNDGAPRRCNRCGSTDIRKTVRTMEDSIPTEIEYDCANCTNPLSFWAYGYFQPVSEDPQ